MHFLVLLAAMWGGTPTFLDYCRDAGAAGDTRTTVSTLLAKAGSADCEDAAKKLATLDALDLTGEAVADLRPVAALTRLRSLNLSFTGVTDLQPLVRMTELRVLNLWRTDSLTSLAPLGDMPWLESLYLLDLPQADEAALSRVKGLRHLMFDARDHDLAFLVNLRLRSLHLFGGYARGLAAVPALPQLEALDADYSPAPDAAALAKFPKLRVLKLRATGLADAAVVAPLRALEFLDLTYDPVTTLAPLARLPALRGVWAGLGELPADAPCPLAQGFCELTQDSYGDPRWTAAWASVDPNAPF